MHDGSTVTVVGFIVAGFVDMSASLLGLVSTLSLRCPLQLVQGGRKQSRRSFRGETVT